MRLRPATDGDRDAVLELAVAEEAAWFGEPEASAAEVGEWFDEEGGMTLGVVAVDEDGAVRGFASPGRHHSLYVADPERLDEAIDALLPWLLAEAGEVDLETFSGDRPRIAALERHGLEHVRSAFTLARPGAAGPLPGAAEPEGVVVAPYALGTDDAAVHRAPGGRRARPDARRHGFSSAIRSASAGS